MREERLNALEMLIRQKISIAKSYNRRVKSKVFNMGELVCKVILSIDKKQKTLGKWSPHWEGPFKIEKVFSGNTYALIDINSGLKIVSINGKYLKQYKPTIYDKNVQSLKPHCSKSDAFNSTMYIIIKKRNYEKN